MLAEFVEELQIAAIIGAKARGHQLTFEPVDYGILIDVDRQLLAAALPICFRTPSSSLTTTVTSGSGLCERRPRLHRHRG